MTVSVDLAETLEVNYQVLGSGPDVIFIHGLGLSSMKTWRYQLKEFSKNFRVHAYDVRGFGLTNNPTNKFSVQQHSYDLNALMDKIGIDKAALIGFSMGGWISLQFTLDFPERVSALVLSNTTSGLRPDGAKRFVERSENVDKNGLSGLTEIQMRNTFSQNTFDQNSELVKFYKENFENPVENKPKHYAAMFRALSVPVVTPQLHRINCPSLVVCGDSDAGITRGNTPTDAAEILQEGISGAKLHVIKDGGHYAHLEQPDVWNGIVMPFLEGCLVETRK
ncbi:MAG: alpha/beta hydrolase [Cyclobacteriaceae bacterium]|nr:alpha/beta hydrolase [Cyclobacteriaceae bacterium]